jgi:hypothetical protein
MAVKKLAAVLITIGDEMSEYAPMNRMIFLFEIDAAYSLDRVGNFIEQNRDQFGEDARARREICKFRSVKHLLQWADRQSRAYPLIGWHGPFRLA